MTPPLLTTVLLDTEVWLAVKAGSAEEAAERALETYSDLVAYLVDDTGDHVTDVTVDARPPEPRSGMPGVWNCVSSLKAEVPEYYTMDGGDILWTWRERIREAMFRACERNRLIADRSLSFVAYSKLGSREEEELVVVREPEAPKQMFPCKAVLKGKEVEFEAPEGMTLLDAALEKGLAVAWECKAGVCDSCEVIIKQGMENLSPVNDNEINMLGDEVKHGHRLSCQCTVKGPVVFQHDKGPS